MSGTLQCQQKYMGLDVKIEMVDRRLWNEKMKNGEYDITILRFTIMSRESNSFFSEYMLSSGNTNRLKKHGYNNVIK